jgi:uncharacterized oxidoreductase
MYNRMKITGNTFLITGAAPALAVGLPEAFHTPGNRVIIAGRRKQAREPAHIRSFAAQLATRFSKLNILVNNARIMRLE